MIRSLLLATSLFLAGTATAQEDALCTEPGLNLLSDAAGDVDFQFLPAGLPLDPLDLESLHIAQQPQADGSLRLVFTLKVAALPQLLPRQAWFATFAANGKTTYGVRMVVDEQGTEAFQSYLVLVTAEGEVSEGRYPETGSLKPAAPESSYDADGTIRIVVDAKDLGFRSAEGTLSGFNAGSLQQIPTGDTLTQSGDLLALIADGMPDDMSRSGEVAVAATGCASGAKSATPRFGGGLGAGLLALLVLAGLRRRR